ncbi:LOB domain-containing protein 1-like [Trifolium pratense]|uniref:LOB domain-containing protein 1-like n=1 Tax=Trifolium pratense TaxID=57577 RepID=A0A2K3MR59_TRIPR|nr:LOB domain-containing protein 1-like [Trifolium pratense]
MENNNNFQKCACCVKRGLRCNPQCEWRQYFPPGSTNYPLMQDTFSFRHISRWINNAPPENREALIESLTWESNNRRVDPIRGSHRVAIDKQDQIDNLNIQLEAALANNLNLQNYILNLQAQNAALVAAAQAQAPANDQHVQVQNENAALVAAAQSQAPANDQHVQVQNENAALVAAANQAPQAHAPANDQHVQVQHENDQAVPHFIEFF